MGSIRRRRDHELIDAIEAIEPRSYSGTLWRVVREGRDPTQCSRSGGRWDDGTFDVLYTAEEKQGALSEMKFHLMRGQPVMPSKVRYTLYELHVSCSATLQLLDLEAIAALGVDIAKYGQLSYQEKHNEYPRTQDIGEVAHFLEYHGLVVPNARYDCKNVVLFCDRVPPDALEVTQDRGIIDWNETAS